MEIIVITDSQNYEGLIPGAKNVESSKSDLISMLQTQIFLNHHKNIALYLLKDNLPHQFQLPVKIIKQLLDRNDGSVQLRVNHGEYVILSPDVDLVQVFSKFQLSLKHQLKQGRNIHFCFKYWDITIELIIANVEPKLSNFKQLINSPNIYSSASIQNINPHHKTTERLNKIILYIDKDNYGSFLQWIDSNQEIQNTQNFYHNQQNVKLSNEYLTLKQEIDNEKNVFRNKIKMIQAILGQNINIQKLLCEQDGKQENLEFKRLKETFQTIKNIDNVLIQQEKHMQIKQQQLKQKRTNKQQVHYESAKKFANMKKEIFNLEKQIKNLLFKLDCIKDKKQQYLSKSNFQVNHQTKNMLNKQVQEFKNIMNKNKQFPMLRKKQFGSFIINAKDKQNYIAMLNQHTNKNKNGTLSMHNSVGCFSKLTKNRYFKNLQKKAKQMNINKDQEDMNKTFDNRYLRNKQSHKSIGSMSKYKCKNILKNQQESRVRKRQIVKLQQLLVKEYQYCKYCEIIKKQINIRIKQKKSVLFPAHNLSMVQDGEINFRQYPLLQKIINENISAQSLSLLPIFQEQNHDTQKSCVFSEWSLANIQRQSIAKSNFIIPVVQKQIFKNKKYKMDDLVSADNQDKGKDDFK